MGEFQVSWPRTTDGPCLVGQGQRGSCLAGLPGSGLQDGAWHSEISAGMARLQPCIFAPSPPVFFFCPEIPFVHTGLLPREKVFKGGVMLS